MKRPRKLSALVLAVMTAAMTMNAWPQSAASSSVSAVPEPYTKDEFPSWAEGLRRYEIVSLGAFPLLLFYTRFGFDLKRFIDNGFSSEYAPWPFKNENSYEATDDEQMTSVLTAAGLSLAFGAVDALLVWISTQE